MNELHLNYTVLYLPGPSKETKYDKNVGKTGVRSLSVSHNCVTTYHYNDKCVRFSMKYMKICDIFSEIRKNRFLLEFDLSTSKIPLHKLKNIFFCKNNLIFPRGSFNLGSK